MYNCLLQYQPYNIQKLPLDLLLQIVGIPLVGHRRTPAVSTFRVLCHTHKKNAWFGFFCILALKPFLFIKNAK